VLKQNNCYVRIEGIFGLIWKKSIDGSIRGHPRHSRQGPLHR
jgi:hypothetical protein